MDLHRVGFCALAVPTAFPVFYLLGLVLFGDTVGGLTVVLLPWSALVWGGALGLWTRRWRAVAIVTLIGFVVRTFLLWIIIVNLGGAP